MAKKNKTKTSRTTNAKKLAKKKALSPELAAVMQQAMSFHQKGNYQMAERGYRQVLSHQPDSPDANQYMGLLAHHVGQARHAVPFFKKALEVDPNNVAILSNYGVVLTELDQFGEAAEIYEHCVKLNPRFAEGYYNLGKARYGLNQLTEAFDAYSLALKFDKKNVEALNNRGNVLKDLCRMKEAMTDYEKALSLKSDYTLAASNIAMVSNYRSDLSAEQVFEYHQTAGKAFSSIVGEQCEVDSRKDRTRVGYISSDLYAHSVAYFFLPLLKNHNKEVIEVICYSTSKKSDAMTDMLKASAEHWRDCSRLSDLQLYELLKRDELDLLVELNGHTADNSLSVLSKRVAPKQLTWLGYPNTTALPTMDYRLVDEITDPVGMSDSLATETLLRISSGFLCYEGDASIPYKQELPSANADTFSFGSFNNLAKVNDDVVGDWIQILLSVPESRFIMKSKQLSDESVRLRFEKMFIEGGIEKSRISLLGPLPKKEDHLGLYEKIDLALDTYPYNGTTTTCEALWMGVPTLTFSGDRHAARVGASILHRVGLDRFVAGNRQDFVNKAIELAQDREYLASVRSDLRSKMLGSDLCDAEKFAQQVEEAYLSIVAHKKS